MDLLLIINEAIDNRIKAKNDNDVIRLSTGFMDALIKEAKKTGIKITNSHWVKEFEYQYNDKPYRIEHRFYRDDGTDDDIEKLLFKKLNEA